MVGDKTIGNKLQQEYEGKKAKQTSSRDGKAFSAAKTVKVPKGRKSK